MVVFFRNELSVCDSGSARSLGKLWRDAELCAHSDDECSVAQFEFLLGLGARLRRKIVTQPFSVIRLRPRAVVAINP